MQHSLKKLEKSQVEFTFTVPPADYQKDLEQAAIRISERAAIKGFRPGKAPYDIVKQQVGEIKILEEALELIVQRTFYRAVKEEKVDTIGMPQISVDKIAPGNDLVYRATVAIMPKVMLPELASIKIQRKPAAIGDKEVADALANLQKMQPKETAKPCAAGKNDKVTIDMEMFIDRVPVEGGSAKNHQVYLNEPHYIPGLAEKLVGLKKDDRHEFSLPFPTDHYQKYLAGRDVDFKIKVNEVFELKYPDLDDEFAKNLGQKSLEKLKELLLANLAKEAEHKEDERFEVAVLETLIEKSEFDDLPQILVDSEKRKMFYELKHDLERRGATIEQYLAGIKKTEEQIFKDFTDQAVKRAKAALLSREISSENNIGVTADELAKEIEIIKQSYPGDAKVEENLKRPEVVDTISASLQNRKVIAWLKEKIK